MTWRELLDRHGPALLLYARQWTGSRPDAEDAVQEGFLRFWRSKKSMDPSTNGCMPLLFTSVRWAAIDGARSRKRRSAREDRAQDLLKDSVFLMAAVSSSIYFVRRDTREVELASEEEQAK